MKSLFNVIASGIALGVSYMAGVWLWDEVLEDKAYDLKDRLSKKD